MAASRRRGGGGCSSDDGDGDDDGDGAVVLRCVALSCCDAKDRRWSRFVHGSRIPTDSLSRDQRGQAEVR